MTESRNSLLNTRPGEWPLVAALLLLLALNTLVLELSDVVATAGFVAKIGAQGLPWLWLADMAVTLAAASGYLVLVDRVPRVKLITGLMGALALTYIGLAFAFQISSTSWVSYLLLYIIADQQFTFFPLAFWTLATDVYSLSEAKRLFPLIGAGYVIGSVAGNLVASLTSGAVATTVTPTGVSHSGLLILGAAIFLAGMALVWLTFRNRPVRARQAREADAGMVHAVRESYEFLRDVPLFRFLALGIGLVGLALTIVEFHFLLSAEQSLGSAAQFQGFYGIYKATLILVTLAVQWLFTGRWLEKVPLKNAFYALPAALTVASIWSLLMPGLVAAAGGRFFARLVERAWDEPARKSVQGLIPDERRGRISTVLDSYLYTVATIVGSLVIGGLGLAATAGLVPPDYVPVAYLLVAILAALGAVRSAMYLHQHYDSSMLNWRLARPRRKSVLDNLDF